MPSKVAPLSAGTVSRLALLPGENEREPFVVGVAPARTYRVFPTGLPPPPPPSPGEENRLPIFESVESDWFRRGKHGANWPATVSSSSAVTASQGWSSPGDEGWQAAEVAQAPVSGGQTRAGLPKRVPKANLVPGGVVTPTVPPQASPRSASQARERFSSFQQGIRNARAVMPEDQGINGDADSAG